MRRSAVLVLGMIVVSVFFLAERPGVGADGATCNAPYNRPDGQFVQWAGTQGVVQGCQKRGFTDTVSRDSHRLPGPPAVLSNDEMATLASGPALRAREGTVLRSPGGSIYVIDELGAGSYQKRFVSSSGWSKHFSSCGTYPVVDVSDAYLSGYATGSSVTGTTLRPDGQLIRNPAGTIFLINGGVKKGFPSSSALASHDFQWPVCNVSDAEAGQYPTSNCVLAREGTLARDDRAPVYVIDYVGPCSSQKRHITSTATFSYYGYSWANVQVWSRSEVDRYAVGPHAHPVKSLYPDRWYQYPCGNPCNYLNWMTLSFDRRYFGDFASGWDAPITNARNAWNSESLAPNTVYFSESAFDPIHDIHVEVDHYGFTPWLAQVQYRAQDNSTPVCPSAQSCREPRAGVTWWYAYVQINVDRFTSPPNPQELEDRQAIVAHELGHAIVLKHEPCGSGSPLTVMIDGCWPPRDPALWDSCGINHAYYDPNVGWAGC